MRLAALLLLWATSTFADSLYLPMTAQHAPSKQALNERNLGIGYSRPYGAGEAFALTFQDSHRRPSYMAGMSFVREWGGECKAGIGGSVFAMSRASANHYRPFPAALPFIQAGCGRARIVVSYIPETSVSKVPAVFIMLKVDI